MEQRERIQCEDITDEVRQKYREDGYELVFQEYVMEHDLQAVPDIRTAPPFVLKNWTAESQSDFYEIYHASFRDRPGFPRWSMEKWIDWVSSSPSFRRDLSYIISVDHIAVGFITTDNDPDLPHTHAYIIQVGVTPDWRRKGIARVLTTTCLQTFRAEGKEKVTLHVNENNPGAIRLYELLGFQTVRVRGTFVR